VLLYDRPMLLRQNAKVELISRVPLFAGCSKRELGLIAGITDEIVQPTGSELTIEGRKGREFCILIAGTADVTLRDAHLRTLSAGDFFGEIALLLDAPRSATVTATSDVRLLVIDKIAFQRLLREAPAIQGKLLEALATRLANESL
jgi:CRP/FNR family transcriptional regulator, cyclic AMP receptor protein